MSTLPLDKWTNLDKEHVPCSVRALPAEPKPVQP